MLPKSKTKRKYGVAFTMAEARKALHPYPVYECRFQDRTVVRMSFWTRTGKPFDFASGRRCCELHRGMTAVDGFVEHDVPGKPWVRVRDPHFSGEAVEVAKPRSSKTALQKAALMDACREAVAVMCNVNLPYSVQMAGEKARKALDLAA